MKILVKGKVETVSLDRVKPAHLECEPTTGTTIQRKTPNKPQSSKTTRPSSRNPQVPPRPGSADTSVVLKLVHSLQRWLIIKSTLVQRLIFTMCPPQIVCGRGP